MNPLSFPFIVHFVNHDGGAHHHQKVDCPRELSQEISRQLRIQPERALKLAKKLQMRKSITFSAYTQGLDAVVWGTQQ